MLSLRKSHITLFYEKSCHGSCVSFENNYLRHLKIKSNGVGLLYLCFVDKTNNALVWMYSAGRTVAVYSWWQCVQCCAADADSHCGRSGSLVYTGKSTTAVATGWPNSHHTLRPGYPQSKHHSCKPFAGPDTSVPWWYVVPLHF